ncbi:MAG: TonB-dependent receptor domain-containing protein [Gammaproteobacteria bacterium]|tara:strand:+ start:79 stop:2994 length:2916 start_codon:yes stop_codon:yes gene_type:complete
MKLKKLYLLILLTPFVFSQDNSNDSDVEEVVVVGSQIKGAKITGALPVSVISSEDMEALGIDSGDELLDNIAELGQNTFNQNEFSGGYNASRGDVGAFNLRDIGTGNTLTLLNGRRLITSPGYQTEPILGGSMPVMTTNSNAIPVNGADRVEILRDGASAIYGADALAGVVNTVLKTDFVGARVRLKNSYYDAYDAEDSKLSIQWGKDFGNTNVSLYFDRYDRQKIAGNEDPKWLAQDARVSPGLGEFDGTAWDDTSWRNTNAASQYGVWHGGGSRYLRVVPDTGSCTYTGASEGNGTCVSTSSSSSSAVRAQYNTTRWMRPDLERTNLFVFINTELNSGVEAYSEIGMYNSLATQQLYGGTTLGAGSCARTGSCTQPLLVPLSNYWLNQLVDSDGDKLVGSSQIRNDLGLFKARNRFDTPRGYDSHRTTIRLLQGFRGTRGKWDWDTGFLLSQAKSKQNNTGRQSLTLLNQALALATPDAYNPFCGPNCNDESSFTIDILRGNTTALYMMDFKASTPELFNAPAGPVGMLVGMELRRNKYSDDRDPRINGEIPYTVPAGPKTGETFPIISDIVNSSATPNSNGSRTTTSVFTEFAIPLHETVDAQLAVRYEDSDDYGDATVGKLAIGWQPIDQVKIRYSTSETFRAPAMILVNEGYLGRSSSTDDALLALASGEDQDNYSMQRITEGNKGLKPELGENESIGIVLEPIDNLIITVDKWSIETEDTVGVFGMTNAVLLDALIRAEGGASQCTGNPNVIRFPTPTTDVTWPATLCPAGLVQQVNDYYVNTDTRTIEGQDTSILYSIDTDFGDFGFKFVNVHYDTKNQAAGGDARRLSDAGQPGGALAGIAPVRGVDNLLGLNGSIEDKYTMKMTWRKGPYEVFLSGTQWGEFFESAHTETIDGVREMWVVDEMTMLNLTLGYKFDNGYRVRLQVKNLEDARAPLADETFSMYWGDLHTDFGRNYNVEFYKKF